MKMFDGIAVALIYIICPQMVMVTVPSKKKSKVKLSHHDSHDNVPILLFPNLLSTYIRGKRPWGESKDKQGVKILSDTTYQNV